jgi:hypothetical protein
MRGYSQQEPVPVMRADATPEIKHVLHATQVVALLTALADAITEIQHLACRAGGRAAHSPSRCNY